MLELVVYPIISALGTVLGWIGSLLWWILKLLVSLSLAQMFLAMLVYLFGYMIQVWEYFFPPKPTYSCLEKPDTPKTAAKEAEEPKARPRSREYF